MVTESLPLSGDNESTLHLDHSTWEHSDTVQDLLRRGDATAAAPRATPEAPKD